MSCKVGNQTNSQDPQAVNSRVFVGNLNTFQCSKTDVERRFQRYGRIAGISMHKGYAFIQFTNPFDARSACLGEDARLLWGQTLDVNMVAEPKSHQTGRKRQNVAKTGNDWDYYYDSYYAQVGFPTPRLVPPLKRARIHVPPLITTTSRTPSPQKSLQFNNKSQTGNGPTTISQLKSYSTPDILICGNCRELYSDVEQLMEHKKSYCKLRFTCKCHTRNGCSPKPVGEEPASLLCSQCKSSFFTAWDLMVHVQAAHMLNIYQLGDDIRVANSGDQTEGIEEDVLVPSVPPSFQLANDDGGTRTEAGDLDSCRENHNGSGECSSAGKMSTSHGHSSGGSLPGGIQLLLKQESNGVSSPVDEENDGESPEFRTTSPSTPSEIRITPHTTTTIATSTSPMEVSTQTQPNPNNFDETCSTTTTGLHKLGGVNGLNVMFPFTNTNGPTPIENNKA